MNTIDAQNAQPSSAQPSSVRDAFNLSSGREQSGGTDKSARADEGQDRTVNDTVTLSDGAQKIVNLNRGKSLADELRDAPVDQDFASNLENATNDVFRISELFNKTVRAAFSLWR